MTTAKIDRDIARDISLTKFLDEAVDVLAVFMDSTNHHDQKMKHAFENGNTIALKFLALQSPDDAYGRGLDYLDAVRRMAKTPNKTTALTTLREAYNIVLAMSSIQALVIQERFDKVWEKYQHEILV